MTEPRGTVLVVDDSEIALEVVRERLERKGFRVLTTDSPMSAARVMMNEHPDIVLMDVEMPSLQGDRATAVLRRSVPGATPVILHSTLADDVLAARATACGASGFLQKTGDDRAFSVRFDALWSRLRLDVPRGAR